jgi:hypothetical protein
MQSRKEEKESLSSHRKSMKTIENKGFLTDPNAMGRSVAVKTPANYPIANKINGFMHVSYGTALKKNCSSCRQVLDCGSLLPLFERRPTQKRQRTGAVQDALASARPVQKLCVSAPLHLCVKSQ